MKYSDYPDYVIEDIVRMRRRIEESGVPEKTLDRNLIVGTWNVRGFGSLYPEWTENTGSPKRNLRGLACIAEVVRRFDVIAIQEVKRDTRGVRTLVNDFLGENWGLILSDVTAGAKGNSERFAFLFDKRRVQPSGLAGEIVLPPSGEGDPVEQFDRTPYIVGFQVGSETFTLLTAHIRYGDVPEDRVDELTSVADYTSDEIRERAVSGAEERNLVVLGDFNIDLRGENPLFQAFISRGLIVPPGLQDLKTTYSTEPKYYDQIAWFMGDMSLEASGRAGVVDFSNSVYQEMTRRSMSYRISDHLPLWVEFLVDHSTAEMATALGLDPAWPDPFGSIPD